MQALEHDTDKREQINRFIVDLQKLKCLVENLLQRSESLIALQKVLFRRNIIALTVSKA
jgi:hypothetical protein